MGKSKETAPAPPNAQGLANTQFQANRDAAIESALLNQLDEFTPFGRKIYTGEIGTPDRTVTTALTPEGQAILDQRNKASMKYGQIGNEYLEAVAPALSTPPDFSGIGPGPQVGQESYDRAYDAIIARNQPRADRARDAMMTRLSNQGLDAGSEAYDTATDEFNRGETDFGLAAQQAAMGQQARQYSLESAAYNQARNDMIAERAQPLNELAALSSGQQFQYPQFQGGGGVNLNPANIADMEYANYQGALNAYNQNQNYDAINRQGIYDLLGTAAMAGGMSYGGPGWGVA
tara:strand:+ start:3937 stop:4806 length:870 start_codon:yes stop_codon:yes gene_type:complete